MRKTPIILLLIILAGILSCTNNPTGPLKARFQLSLQDSSAPFDSIFVNIEQVAIRPNSQYLDSLTGWSILIDEPATYDMVKLRNGHRQQIFNRDIVVGFYKTLRIRFGTCFAVRNDTVFFLEFPNSSYRTSADSSNILKITSGQTIQTLVDINLISSINYNADSSRYYFTPEFRFIEIDSTGLIKGYIDHRSDIYLTLTSDSTVNLAMTSTETDGYFGFFGLPENIYSIFIFPKDTTYQNQMQSDLAVYPGTIWDLDTISLSPR